MTIFNETHINQPVYTNKDGDGTIISVSKDGSTISVKFACGLTTFTNDGRSFYYMRPELKFGYAPKEFDYGKPKFIYTPFEFTGEAVWCWTGNCVAHVENKKEYNQVVAGITGLDAPYLAIRDGYSNTECKETRSWAYALPLSKKELEGFLLHN